MFSSLYDPHSSAYFLNTNCIWWWRSSPIAEDWKCPLHRSWHEPTWPLWPRIDEVSKGEWQGSSHQSVFILHPEGATAQGPFSGGQASRTRVPLSITDSEPGHPAEGISEMKCLSLSSVCPECPRPMGMLFWAVLCPFSSGLWEVGSFSVEL